MPIVNGHQAETGCYVDGHWGQYGPDHLADKAEDFGWTADKPTDDPRIIRAFVEEIEEAGYNDGDYLHVTGMLWEFHSEAADDIETWLNARTSSENEDGDQPGYVWHWRDGEFYLSPTCEDGDCDDDTCAHHD